MLLALSMIVKNEAENLRALLAPIRHRFDEVVICDTGSTDNTVTIAESLDCRVVRFAWNDSFTDARNAALLACTAPWIMWLDADHRVRSRDVKLIRRLLDVRTPKTAFWVTWNDPNGGKYKKIMVFPRLPHVSWEGMLANGAGHVHEDVLPSLLRQKVDLIDSEVEIEHMDRPSLDDKRARMERNLRLLALDEALEPFNPFVLYHSCVCLMNLARNDEALAYAKRLMALAPEKLSVTTVLAAVKAARLSEDAALYGECLRVLWKYAPDHPVVRLLVANATGDKSVLEGVEFVPDEVPYNPDAAKKAAEGILAK